MDAVDFLKQYRRMCKKYIYADSSGEDCAHNCPLYGQHCDLTCEDLDAEYVVKQIKLWNINHPIKTILQDFLEKYPNAVLRNDGTPNVCPQDLGYLKENKNKKDCDIFKGNCLKCWSRELE